MAFKKETSRIKKGNGLRSLKELVNSVHVYGIDLKNFQLKYIATHVIYQKFMHCHFKRTIKVQLIVWI